MGEQAGEEVGEKGGGLGGGVVELREEGLDCAAERGSHQK